MIDCPSVKSIIFTHHLCLCLGHSCEIKQQQKWRPNLFCYSCGDKDHSKSEKCWVRNRSTVSPPSAGVKNLVPCAYCGEDLHVLTTCPYLHGNCRTCGRGGHISTECSLHTTEEWLVKYITYAADGIGTGMNKRAPLGGKFGFGQVWSTTPFYLSHLTVSLSLN